MKVNQIYWFYLFYCALEETDFSFHLNKKKIVLFETFTNDLVF